MGAPLKVRDIERALVRKGMRKRESHHTMFVKAYPGGPTLITRISHGLNEYSDSMLSEVAKQLALANVGEVRDLVECTLSAEAWDEKVTERCPSGVNPYIRFRS